jgi:hypothetical protein
MSMGYVRLRRQPQHDEAKQHARHRGELHPREFTTGTEPVLVSNEGGLRKVNRLLIAYQVGGHLRVHVPADLLPGIYQVTFQHVLIRHTQSGQNVYVLSLTPSVARVRVV